MKNRPGNGQLGFEAVGCWRTFQLSGMLIAASTGFHWVGSEPSIPPSFCLLQSTSLGKLTRPYLFEKGLQNCPLFPPSPSSIFKDLLRILGFQSIYQNIIVKDNKNIKWVYVHERVKEKNVQAFSLKLALWNVGNVLNIRKAELYIIIHGNFLNVRVSYHGTYTLEIKWPIVLKLLLFRYLLKH